jgi:hypothetical protein
MSRMQILVQRPKRTLAALATVLVAVGLTTASGADFNAQSANAANTFTAGSLTMDNSLPGAAILTAGNMRPSDPTTNAVGTVDIKNTGSLSGVFTLSKGTLTDTPSSPAISAKLNATIVDCGVYVGATPPVCGTSDTLKYSGTIAAMGTVALGTYASLEHHRYKFTVALDGSAGNVYQGGSSTAQFVWDAS